MGRIIVTAIAVWALAISPLTACGKGKETPATTPTTAAAVSATPPSTSLTRSLTKADLDAAILTLADLPAGYTLNTQPGPAYTVMSSCTDEALALEGYGTGAQAKAGIAFSGGSGDLVVQSVTLLSGDVADNTLAALRKAVARCTTWTIGKSTYTMSKADYGPYGDETLSYRVNATSEVAFILDIVFMRKANLLVAVMIGGQGSGPSKDAQAIFGAAARKLPRQ